MAVLDVRLTTYDGRDRLATMRHATVASRKVVMSLAHVACRKSYVPPPRNDPGTAATGETPVVPVGRQDGGSPYGRDKA